MVVGYWSPQTGDMNFCEPDYAVSHYVAEFWNTVTSFAIVWVGAAGILLCRWQDLGREQMLCYACIAVVGCGSVAFHATLLRTGQVLDEVPMLWSVTALVYGAAHHAQDRVRRRCEASSTPSPPSISLVAVRSALISYSIAATVLYFASGFLVFITMYALSIVALLYVAFTAIYRAKPQLSSARPRSLLTSAAVA